MKTTTEGKLKSKLRARILERHPDWVVIAHQERSNSGVPDLSVTTERGTFWLELKYATPRFTSTSVQDVTCVKLEAVGKNCFHVIYIEHNAYGRLTYIASPKAVLEGTLKLGDSRTALRWFNGFGHDGVIDFLELPLRSE